MAVISMQQLLDAGVHFGHQTRRWNPKMRRFIHGDRAGIHIVDLHQTLRHLEASYVFVRDLIAGGGTVLFIGTKRQAQDSIRSYAERCNMPYVNERWLGGMLTNFQTISKRVGKMQEFRRMRDSGELEAMPKKEALLVRRELAKLERNLAGIRGMEKLPDAIFVLDTKKEHIAVTEARKIGVPIVAVVDTNCDPDLVDYAIPGNDDAIRSGDLMCRVISDAVIEGRYIHSRRNADDAVQRDSATEAEVAEQQAQARAEAAAAAAEREARIAAAASGDGESHTEEAPETATAVSSAATTSAEAAGTQGETGAEPADALDPAEAGTGTALVHAPPSDTASADEPQAEDAQGAEDVPWASPADSPEAVTGSAAPTAGDEARQDDDAQGEGGEGSADSPEAAADSAAPALADTAVPEAADAPTDDPHDTHEEHEEAR